MARALNKFDVEKRENAAFLQGFACALGSLAREHGEPSVAVDIMHINGITYDELKLAKADPFDLKPIRREWKSYARGVARKGQEDRDGK